MRRVPRPTTLASAVLAFLGLLWLTSPVPAAALTVSSVKVAKGVVHVVGKGAQAAIISWEGEQVDQSSAKGAFAFDTTVLPPDCVGTLSDGIQTLQVVIAACGPVGIQGPPGPQGPVLLAAFDANGAKIGDVVTVDHDRAVVRVDAGGHSFILQMFRDRLLGPGGDEGDVFFLGTDCTGQALLVERQPSNPLPAVAVSRGVAYMADVNTAASQIETRSYLQGFSGACVIRTETRAFVEADKTADLSGFVTPFLVRAP